MNEIIFLVEEAPEGGFTARALDHSIFTEAESWSELPAAVRDAVACHFEPANAPRMIRLHLVPRHRDSFGCPAGTQAGY